MAMIYYSERDKAESVKRKGAWGEVPRKPGISFKATSLSGEDVLNFPSIKL